MGHGKHKGYGFRAEPPVPIAEYNVSGTLTPDATCNYAIAGTWNGQPCYRRFDGEWHIWWYLGPSYWIISRILGEIGVGYWYKTPPITGIYTTVVPATGIATVAVGPH